MDYFFFGSLRDVGILAAVIGAESPDGLQSRLRFEAGELTDYRANRVIDEDYPLLVPEAGAVVPGLVVGGMRESEIERIRFFEDTHYDPSRVTVRLTDTREQKHCLVFLSLDLSENSGDPWHFDAWPLRDRQILRIAASYFMSHYGHRSHAEADVWWDDYISRATAIVDGE